MAHRVFAEKTSFDKVKYFEHLEQYIRNRFEKEHNTNPSSDITDTEKTRKYKLNALKLKQHLMILGQTWQEALGSYDGFTNLKQGDKTHLDIISRRRKLAIEVKNRTDTTNGLGKKATKYVLATFKNEHPDYTCILLEINIKSKNGNDATLHKGKIKKIIWQGVEIELHTGVKALRFILGDDTAEVIEFITTMMDKYTHLE
jgi:hypothetical protein